MKFQYNDGGREAAGYKGKTGDCVARAIAIAMGRDYQHVCDDIEAFAEMSERGSKRSSAAKGVYTSKKWFREYLTSLGWKFVPTMSIGSGCKVHLRADELPSGTIICSVSKHYVAVIDGVMHDIYDPSRNGTRCVYGYWIKGGAA